MKDSELQKLRRETADYLFQYLNKGVIPEDQILEKVVPEDSDIPKEKIEKFDQLVDIHFLMQDDVKEFVDRLENRLRTIKTDTKSKKVTNRGQIDGKIDWGSTVKKRYSENPQDNSVFVVNDKKENHDIDRNILLKKYLDILIKSYDNVEEIISGKNWAKENWDLDNSASKIQQLKQVKENNVHIQRIREAKEYEPTERMIEKAESSRRKIYREAAQGYKQRQKYRNGEDLSELLKTVIQPSDNTLLELALVFNTIDKILEMGNDYTLRPISSEMKEEKWIAQIQITEEKKINVYHDETTEKTDFKPDKTERRKEIDSQYRDILKEYLGVDSNDSTRRPDMILELKEGEEVLDYLLAEVKNKNHEQGFKEGLEELLEYMAYGTENGEYIFSSEHGLFGSSYNGILFTRELQIPKKARSDLDQHSVQALEYSDQWEEQLGVYLERWLSSTLS
ncbi:MAG: hypothetical protein ABEJ83_01845 [Candidatus Nanohaloarchaea archaeon]